MIFSACANNKSAVSMSCGLLPSLYTKKSERQSNCLALAVSVPAFLRSARISSMPFSGCTCAWDDKLIMAAKMTKTNFRAVKEFPINRRLRSNIRHTWLIQDTPSPGVKPVEMTKHNGCENDHPHHDDKTTQFFGCRHCGL